jgi:thiol-disulfide isomerase/thioredoxin
MLRCWTCFALLAGLALLCRADDPAPQKTTEGGEALAALMKELRSRLVEVISAGDKRKKVVATYSGKLLAHARDYPDDPSAVEALVAVLRFNPPGAAGKSRQAALDLLKKRYIKSKLVRRHLRGLFGTGTDADCVALVRAVYQDNPDRLTRALAGRALANGLERSVKLAEVFEKDPRARSLHERSWGKEAVRKMIDDVPAMRKEMARTRAALRTDFKDVLPDLSPGAAAPETVGEDIDGRRVALADFKGKVVVLDFWATWCGPCRERISPTRELVKKMKGRPFAYVSVSTDERKITLTTFLQKNRMPWTHWYDGRAGKLAGLWDVEVFPTVCVIDHKGIIRLRQVGHEPDSESFERAVEKLVKAAEADRVRSPAGR